MSLPVTEFVVFNASEAFRENPDVLGEALGKLPVPEGLISVHYGLQVEDQKTGYWLNVWETKEHHTKLTQEKAAYAALVQAVKPIVSGKFEIQHVHFNAELKPLSLPIVEILTLTPKAPEHRDALVELLGEFSKDSEGKVVFGEIHEKKDSFIMLLGWPSVEAHYEALKIPSVSAGLERMGVLSDADIKHFKISKI